MHIITPLQRDGDTKMPFVKLDTGILDSTLWVERECREVFITALLLAEPYELLHELPQIAVRNLELTGFMVPPGWYGFVDAAGVGIVRRSLVAPELGMMALEQLGSPDPESRSTDFEGRRLVRVAGGFIVLNFMKYRDRDYTSAERSKRYRERHKQLNKPQIPSHRDPPVRDRDITQAEVILRGRGNTNPSSSSLRSDDVPPVSSSSVLEKQNQIPTPVNSSTWGSRLNVPQLPDDWAEFCRQERPDLDPAAVFESFRDHWRAAAGSRGVKADWLATWRNWVRKETRKPGTDDLQPGAREYLRRHSASDAAAAANITDQEATDEPY